MKTVLFNKRRCCAVLGALAVIVVLVLMAVGIYFLLSVNYGVDDGYALWGAADMVIDYMKTHDGNWPRNWIALQPQFRANNGRVGGWSFKQFQERIVIDFNADPEQLCKESLASSHATFRVIWPRHDWGVRIGNDPNQMLCDYFRETASQHAKLPIVPDATPPKP